MSKRSDPSQDQLWLHLQKLHHSLRYVEGTERLSMTPGVYFRMILRGHVDGIASEGGICWRVSDPLAWRRFVGLGLKDRLPAGSWWSRICQRPSLEITVHMFERVLEILPYKGLVEGRNRWRKLRRDVSSLELAASMRSIRWKTDGGSYREYTRQQMQEAGEHPEGLSGTTCDDCTWKSPGERKRTLPAGRSLIHLPVLLGARYEAGTSKGMQAGYLVELLGRPAKFLRFGCRGPSHYDWRYQTPSSILSNPSFHRSV